MTLRTATPEPTVTFEALNSRFDTIRHGVALARDVLLIVLLLFALYTGASIYQGLSELGDGGTGGASVQDLFTPEPMPAAPECLGEEPVVGCPR